MVALLAVSLLAFSAGSSQGSGTSKPVKGEYGDVPLSRYFNFDNAQKADYMYIAAKPLFRGGLEGVTLRRRLLIEPGIARVRPGLEFIPSDSRYQGLVALWGYTLPGGCGDDDETDPPVPDLIASISHGPFVQATTQRPSNANSRRVTIHVACTQMNKMMPSNMEFTIAPCHDPILAKLCAIDSDMPIRGIYDQPRIWIYTDHATMADCNEHLTKPVTPSIYLRAIWEASTVGAVDLSNSAIQKCVEPSLIEGINAPMPAKVWLIAALDQVNPDGLLKQLQTKAEDFQGMVPDDGRAANMAGLLDALADSKTPAVVAALPKFIDAAIPPDRRDAVLSKCKHKF